MDYLSESELDVLLDNAREILSGRHYYEGDLVVISGITVIAESLPALIEEIRDGRKELTYGPSEEDDQQT